MADRNCKFFSPNYFNPTKCQNCFKPKEQHTAQDAAGAGKQALRKAMSLPRVNMHRCFAILLNLT